MTSFEFSSDVPLEVPPQCQDCPMVAMHREEYNILSSSQSSMFEAFASDTLEGKVKAIMRKIDPSISDEILEEHLRSTLGDMREEAVPIFEGLTEQREVIQEQVDLDTQDCLGPSAMRAADKLGRMVVVRFCTSPRRQLGADPYPYPEPVYIERTTEQ